MEDARLPDFQPIDGMVWEGKVNTRYGRLTSSYETRRVPYEPVLQLYSDQAAAGTGGLPKGLSGAPVIVGTAAVGLLRTSLLEGERATPGRCMPAAPRISWNFGPNG